MRTITAKGYAKINIFLDIVGVLCNGYHLMEMITQTVDLFDIITITKTKDNDINFSCNIQQLIYNDNIILKAANAFFAETKIKDNGIDINLQKNIPSRAGMGGGSADGAAALVILNELYSTGLSEEHLMEIGMKIGSDIPCLIRGGTCRVSGMGEDVTKIKDLSDCYFVIVKPKDGISTKSAFSKYDDYQGYYHKKDINTVIDIIDKGDILGLNDKLFNLFENIITINQSCEIKDIFQKTYAITSLMTGSGSCIYGIYKYKKHAILCESIFKLKGYETFLVKPVKTGALIV